MHATHHVLFQDLDFIEFYAGKAACTTAARKAGRRAVKFDIGYFDRKMHKNLKSNFYDVLSDSGFTQLGPR